MRVVQVWFRLTFSVSRANRWRQVIRPLGLHQWLDSFDLTVPKKLATHRQATWVQGFTGGLASISTALPTTSGDSFTTCLRAWTPEQAEHQAEGFVVDATVLDGLAPYRVEHINRLRQKMSDSVRIPAHPQPQSQGGDESSCAPWSISGKVSCFT